MIRKLLLSDGRTERELLLSGTLVVGRDPSCDISDLDPLLSRRHAEFVSNAQGLVVRDLGSRNGILVNGVKVPERKLTSGDVVQLGHLHLRYVEDVAPPPAPAQRRQAEETTATALEQATMLPQALRTAMESAPPRGAGAPAGMDVTRLPGAGRPASTDFDVTIAPRAARKAPDVDVDVTMAPGAGRKAADVEVTMPPGAGRKAIDVDVTMAPSAGRAPSPDFDVTMAPGARPGTTVDDDTQAPVAPTGDARLTVSAHLKVTEASAACRTLLGVSPESLVGGPVTDALMLAVRSIANGSGVSPLAISVARTAPGGTLTVTFKGGPAGETSQ